MNLIDQIIADEIYEGAHNRFAYKCPLGKWTIGYGRNIDEDGGKGITEAEARIMLHGDLIECDNDLSRLFGVEFWKELGSVRRYALINMRYQLGPNRFRGFVNMISAVKKRQWGLAMHEILDSNYALQVPRRAERIAFEISDGIST